MRYDFDMISHISLEVGMTLLGKVIPSTWESHSRALGMAFLNNVIPMCKRGEGERKRYDFLKESHTEFKSVPGKPDAVWL